MKNSSRKPLFRRLFLQSNAAMVPAKDLFETREQISELYSLCGISSSLSQQERLDELRKVDADKLMEIVPKLRIHTFRAVRGKGEFVNGQWPADMLHGGFARWCKDEGIVIMMGECANEESVYSRVNSPSGPDYGDSLRRQLHNYYPLSVVDDLLRCYAIPTSSSNPSDWAEVFGRAASDSQVYASERLFVQLMAKEGPPILRYRIDYRPAFLDQYYPKDMGVGHGFDDSLWWFSKSALLEPKHLSAAEADKLISTYRQWLSCFVSFIAGDDDILSRWEAQHPAEHIKDGQAIRRLSSDLIIANVHDDRWTEKSAVIECLKRNLQSAAAEI